MSIKTRMARRAATTTAKHTARGTVSKAKRRPLRSATLFVLGAVAGLLAGIALGGRPATQ